MPRYVHTFSVSAAHKNKKIYIFYGATLLTAESIFVEIQNEPSKTTHSNCAALLLNILSHLFMNI